MPKKGSIGPLERLPEQTRFVAALPATGGITTGMIQDNDVDITLPSNASTDLFLINFKSSHRVALPRQIYLKDGEIVF